MYVSPFFITNREKRETVLRNPKILLTEHTISEAWDLIPALEIAHKKKLPLFILSKSLEHEALSTLVLNVGCKVLKACAVNTPGFGDKQGEQLENIAILTSGTVFVKDQGPELKSITEAHLGTAEKIIIGNNKTTIIADGDKAITIERERRITEKNRERLIKDLNYKNSPRRLSAIGALGMIGDTWVVEPIIKALEDEMRLFRSQEKDDNRVWDAKWFRYTAAWYLSCIGDTRAKSLLVRLFNRTEFPSSRNNNQKSISKEWVWYSTAADALKKFPGVGAEFEQLGLYDKGEEFFNYHGMLEESARIRKLKAEQSAVKVTQKVVHGDEVTKTEIKDSVVSKSNIGSGGDDKLTKIKELKELHDSGAIDDDEFKQMKKEILGK